MPSDAGRNEWLEANAYRAFPFEEDSSFTADDGAVMPSWLVRDARVVAMPRFRARGAVPFNCVRLAAFSCGYGLSSIDLEVCGMHGGSAVVRLSSMDPGVSVVGVTAGYELSPDFLSVTAALCAAGPGEPALEHGDGERHVFTAGPRLLRSRTVYIPGGVGVDSLSMQGGAPMTGTVHVKDGKSTELRVSSGALRLNVYGGAGEGYDCGSPPTGECRYVRFINGQHADSSGNFSITGGPGVSVGTGDYNGMPAITVSTGPNVDEFAARSRS